VQVLRGDQLEVDRDPITPLSDAKQALLLADDQLCVTALRIEERAELQVHLLGTAKKRVVGPFERPMNHVVFDVDLVDHAAGHRTRLARGDQAGRIEAECAVGPQQIRSAHPAQLAAGFSRWRKVRWHPDNGRFNAMRLEHTPERMAASQQLNFP
jgi:hypothetical protein